MGVKQAIAMMLHGMNVQYPYLGGVFGGVGGSVGNINVLQKDMNIALTMWRETGNTNGLKQVAGTMQAMGNLTSEAYEQIMKAIDGED